MKNSSDNANIPTLVGPDGRENKDGTFAHVEEVTLVCGRFQGPVKAPPTRYCGRNIRVHQD
jgi:hypothetical protein